MILDVADEIIDMCAQAVKDSETQKRSRIAAGETLTNAQKSKAVLVTCRGVGNINAETVLSRSRYLGILYAILSELEDPYKWRIPIENIRPTLNWSGRWGPQDDSMLLVGVFLHGFGNWEAMAKDQRLGLEGKFFLDEGKKGEDAASRPIPNAIHLVRRGDFLLSILHKHCEKLLPSFKGFVQNKGSPTRKTASQKAMPLKERDIRALIRSLQRWGDIRQRYDIIVRLTFLSCICSAERLTKFRSRNPNFTTRTRA